MALLLLLTMLLAVSAAQRFPENTCAQYFQYVQDGIGSIQGELTLSLQNRLNRIDVRFSQSGNQDQAVVGNLLPFPDEATVQASFTAAKFRLKLWPDASGMLPKLTRLVFNDVTLCTASEYGPPHSYFNRFYVIPINGKQSTRGSHVVAWANGQTSSTDISFVPWSSTTLSDGSWLDLTSPTTTTITIVRPTSKFEPIDKRLFSPIPNINRANPQPTQSQNIPEMFVCGQEGKVTPFIQRGDEFPRGRYPWLTAIFHKVSFTLEFKCGGSLISNSLIITAAHCVYKMREDRVVVALGRYDLDNYGEEGTEVREVLHIKTHPEYSFRPQLQPDADLAVVTLDRPVTFNDIISPICLWEAAQTEVPNEIGSIAGWGTDENGNSMTRYPRVVNAKIATRAECARKWKVQNDLERTLCAGNLDGSGPCLGDSGGGLMIKRNNRWLLRGIVSLGERATVGSCNLEQYVLYCDLSKHLDWISRNLS